MGNDSLVATGLNTVGGDMPQLLMLMACHLVDLSLIMVFSSYKLHSFHTWLYYNTPLPFIQYINGCSILYWSILMIKKFSVV